MVDYKEIRIGVYDDALSEAWQYPTNEKEILKRFAKLNNFDITRLEIKGDRVYYKKEDGQWTCIAFVRYY